MRITTKHKFCMIIRMSIHCTSRRRAVKKSAAAGIPFPMSEAPGGLGKAALLASQVRLCRSRAVVTARIHRNTRLARIQATSVQSSLFVLCVCDLGHLCCSTLSCPQISGGGCLPPPTPKVRTNNQLGETLGAFFPPDGKSDYQKYSGFLSESLAWRSTTGIGYVVGKGAYVDPTKMVVPENPSEMGMVMRNGRRERINRPRATGDQLHFSTAQQLVNNAIDAHWATPSADRLKIN